MGWPGSWELARRFKSLVLSEGGALKILGCRLCVKQAWYWTIVFLFGQAGHIREGVLGDAIISGAYASFRPSVVPHSPKPKSHSHSFVADRPDLFSGVLSTFEGERALQGEKARLFWNPIITNGSEVEDQRL